MNIDDRVTDAFCDCAIELRGRHHADCPGISDEWYDTRQRVVTLIEEMIGR